METKTITTDLLERAQQHAGSDEGLVSFLKRSGLSKSLSVIAFAAVKGVPRSLAKMVVHKSRAWDDQRESDETLHTTVFRALDHGPA